MRTVPGNRFPTKASFIVYALKFRENILALAPFNNSIAIKKKFEIDSTSESSAFYFEIRKT